MNVIYYEGVAEVNDSILKLVSMSDADRVTFSTDYTNKLKIEVGKEKERLEIEARKQD